ncbi:DNA-binding domain-containing protein [Novosphingobium sp.]|uniref:HvfC/BufC N-terminal domain-containing protein n=1 Tax=Novosphingobium sp. TaxID=1874826 RepID=UPI00262120F7|nr:DNA-binding domain-containing protein [Novosphingobium sp.]
MSLLNLQRDFRDWLVTGEDSAAAALGGGPGTLVYQNNYRTALVSSLAETFQRLVLWLGDEAFEAAAARYIDARPPSSWTLDAYGEDFTDFIATLWPDDPEVAEIALIDWTVGQVFVSPDAEPLAPEALAVADWETAVIRAVPSLLVLPIATNADAIWQALATGETPPGPEMAERGTALLVWRQGLEPVFRRAEAHERDVLAWSAAGQGFAAVCERLAASLGEEAAVTTAGTLLGRWLGERMIAAVG